MLAPACETLVPAAQSLLLVLAHAALARWVAQNPAPLHSRPSCTLSVVVVVPPLFLCEAAASERRPSLRLLFLLVARRHEPLRFVHLADDMILTSLVCLVRERASGSGGGRGGRARCEPDLLLEQRPDLLERQALGLCGQGIGASRDCQCGNEKGNDEAREGQGGRTGEEQVREGPPAGRDEREEGEGTCGRESCGSKSVSVRSELL